MTLYPQAVDWQPIDIDNINFIINNIFRKNHLKSPEICHFDNIWSTYTNGSQIIDTINNTSVRFIRV